MVTAILPSLTDDSDEFRNSTLARIKASRSSGARLSAAFSVESEATITPERYTRSLSNERASSINSDAAGRSGKPSVLAGFVGLFTGCGALLALAVFLPLPAKFGEYKGVTPGEAVSYSFYVVGAVSLLVGVFVSFGLRKLKGEEGKGWRLLFGSENTHSGEAETDILNTDGRQRRVSQLRFPLVTIVTRLFY